MGEVKGERRGEHGVLMGRLRGRGAERGREPERGGWERRSIFKGMGTETTPYVRANACALG